MASIRGIRSLFPCPICLVHKDNLSDLSHVAPRRTTDNMREIYNEARILGLDRKGAQKEKLLKQYGLRDVEVIQFIDLTQNAVLSFS
jgi:hypothetical protein